MEAFMEKKNVEIQAINRQTFSQRLKSYKRSPLSLLLLILVSLSALITVMTLLFLIAYILIKGVPYLTADLFAWEYNSENVSLMPALINTIIMTGLSLDVYKRQDRNPAGCCRPSGQILGPSQSVFTSAL